VLREPRSGFNRVPFVQVCSCGLEDRRTSGLICNLSILGLYIHFANPPANGKELAVRFRLPDDGPPIDALAAVTWVNDAPPDSASALPIGCGVRFLSVAPADMRRIAAVVSKFLAAPREQVQVGIAQPFSGKVRIPFITSCVYTDGKGDVLGSICNLSTLGVYAALERIPEPGERGRIRFQVPGLSAPFDCSATVAWHNPDLPDRVHALPPGCGFRFESLNPIQEAVLTTLVTDYLKALEGVSAGG
jgi:hypothetical protein